MTQTELTAAIADVSPEVMNEVMTATLAAFNDRMTFETARNPNNESIQTKLKAAQRKFSSMGLAAVIHATNVDPQFVNREITEGRRYNIYAADKLADLLAGVSSGTFRNAVNVAVLKSLFKFEAAGLPFTGHAALCATSDKVKVAEKGITKHLTRHSVSAATGPTQASSTMNALQTLGAVVNNGSAKYPVWALTASPVVDHLRARMAA